MDEPTQAEIAKIGRELKWLREDCKMEWCLIAKTMKRPEPELRRILCLHNEAIAKNPEGRQS